MANLGLIPKTNDALRGFMPEELDDHISNIAISLIEFTDRSLDILATAQSNGFSFFPDFETNVMSVVLHFKT